MNNSHFYHYASKGLEDDVLFGSVKAFIAGMNRVAICFLKCLKSSSVLIFAFCLMDNHVHFILYGTEDACNDFMSLYAKLTGMWLANHPEEGNPNKKWDIGHWLIPDKESLVEKICYVLRNPVAAHLPFIPSGYRWSSANLLFTDKNPIMSICRKGSELSVNKQRILFESRVSIPDDWLVLPEGMIWPGCYVNWQKVEKLFKSVTDFNYEMNKKCEDNVNREMMNDHVSLPDGEVRAKAREISGRLFNTGQISTLGVEQRILIAKELKKTMGISSKQIARIIRMNLSDIRLLV